VLFRSDAGYEEGGEVTRHYDPLLAKLIAHGPHRKLALAKLDEALAQTEVLGVRTNLPFLRGLAAHPDVQRGRVDTELVAREYEHLVPASRDASEEALALAAAAIVEGARSDDDPWTASGAFRLGATPGTSVVVHDGSREHALRVEGTGPYRVAGHTLSRDQSEAHAWIADGKPAAAAMDGTRVWTSVAGRSFELDSAAPQRMLDVARAHEVDAPMPGVIIAVHAKPDLRVRRGDLLFALEAMKMELRVEAPADGIVTGVRTAVGQTVARGQRLADFEPDAS